MSGDSGRRGRESMRCIVKGFLLLGTIAAFVSPRSLDCDGQTLDVGRVKAYRPTVDPVIDFQATAYCESGITKSGVLASPGIVAADPRVLPMGSLICVDVPLYRGLYLVMDTGRLVKGNIIDIYIPNYDLATEFGRREAKVTVLRYGFPASAQAVEDEDLTSSF